MNVQCPCCGNYFERVTGRPGRPRKYCSDECRIHMLRTVYQPAYARRQKALSIGRNRWI